MPSLNGQRLRETILRQSRRANTGHIGSALSIADLIVALYSSVLAAEPTNEPDRNRFILSKGHAVLALYGAFYLNGWISAEQLDTYCGEGTMLGVHPEHVLDGIDFSTGSLGHGLSIGAGAAFGAKLQQSSRHVYVLMSDAELNEGSVWEAALFAVHHRLSNLTAVIDVNGQQALGKTKDVMDCEPIAEKWRAFGWDTVEVNGHDVHLLVQALTSPRKDRPKMILARTTFGKGVSFMEGRIDWHYLPMNEDQFNLAMGQVLG